MIIVLFSLILSVFFLVTTIIFIVKRKGKKVILVTVVLFFLTLIVFCLNFNSKYELATLNNLEEKIQYNEAEVEKRESFLKIKDSKKEVFNIKEESDLLYAYEKLIEPDVDYDRTRPFLKGVIEYHRTNKEYGQEKVMLFLDEFGDFTYKNNYYLFKIELNSYKVHYNLIENQFSLEEYNKLIAESKMLREESQKLLEEYSLSFSSTPEELKEYHSDLIKAAEYNIKLMDLYIERMLLMKDGEWNYIRQFEITNELNNKTEEVIEFYEFITKKHESTIINALNTLN